MARALRFMGLAALAFMVASCSQQSTPAPTTEQGIFAIEAQDAAPGGEAQVRVRSLPTSGTVVTVVSQLTYDSSRLKVKDCAIGTGGTVGKQLQWAEPQQGMVTAVVAGGLEPLPQESELLHCSFTVVPGTSGSASLSIHGGVADKPYEEREFSAQGAVIIGN